MKVEVDLSKRPERIEIEDGMYKAKISKFGERNLTTRDGREVPYLDIYFQIQEGKYEGQEIALSVPKKVTFNSRLKKILDDAGVNVEGEEIDLDKTLLGKKATIMVSNSDFIRRDGTRMKIARIISVKF